MNNLIHLADLQASHYNLLTDSQEIAEFKEYGEDITGVVVRVGEGEYTEVYITEYSSPWNLSSIYERVK